MNKLLNNRIACTRYNTKQLKENKIKFKKQNRKIKSYTTSTTWRNLNVQVQKRETHIKTPTLLTSMCPKMCLQTLLPWKYTITITAFY